MKPERVWGEINLPTQTSRVHVLPMEDSNDPSKSHKFLRYLEDLSSKPPHNEKYLLNVQSFSREGSHQTQPLTCECGYFEENNFIF
jgi:hypothetical protein